MISTRGLLLRQLQQFFELHLSGTYPWGQVLLRSPEKAEKKPGRRQLDKELAVVEFGGYALSLQSPEEVPPLGHIEMIDSRSGVKIGGVIDEATWARIGEHIRTHPPDAFLKEQPYVHG